MFVVRIADGRYLRTGRVMDKHSYDSAMNYKIYNGTGDSPYEIGVRNSYLGQVNGWLTEDINLARLFENYKSARTAGQRGPFEFEILEVDIRVTLV